MVVAADRGVMRLQFTLRQVVTALAALGVLAVLPSEAGQRHQVIRSSALTCDNDGHCTTFKASALTSDLRKTRPAIKNASAVVGMVKPTLQPRSLRKMVIG